MTCPYSEPNCEPISATATHCRCKRLLKRCALCETPNRAVANFCRACGASLPVANGNWTAYRGSARRLGFNDTKAGSRFATRLLPLKLQLGDACSSLLGYDGYLIAVSHKGVVEIADLTTRERVARFQVKGPVTAEPCIHEGVLYIAAARQLSAYSLAAMLLDPPRLRPLWILPLDNTPIHALTAVRTRLYVTVASPDWREVHIIDDLEKPAAARRLHGAAKLSWMAADPHQEKAVVLSEVNGSGIQLHVFGADLATRPVALHKLAEHPIAVIGKTVFAVLGDAHRLYRIDLASGAVQEPLEEDTQLFALSHDGDEEWDRGLVHVDTGGIVFSSAGLRDTFEPHDRPVRGSPLIVRDCAGIVAMEDGRVRVYQLSQLPKYESWTVGGGAPITALASFDSYIAAGAKDGVVEIREIVDQGSAS